MTPDSDLRELLAGIKLLAPHEQFKLAATLGLEAKYDPTTKARVVRIVRDIVAQSNSLEMADFMFVLCVVCDSDEIPALISSGSRLPTRAQSHSGMKQRRRAKFLWAIMGSLAMAATVATVFLFHRPNTRPASTPSETPASKPNDQLVGTAGPEAKPTGPPATVATQPKPPVSPPDSTIPLKQPLTPVTKAVSDHGAILVPATKPTMSPAPSPECRTWTDVKGKYHTEATFAGLASGIVTLKKRDGSAVHVPLEKLSKEDQQWVEDYEKGRLSPAQPHR